MLPSKFHKAISTSCFLFNLLAYPILGCYGGKVYAQEMPVPPSLNQTVINNLNVRPSRPIKVPDPLEDIKTTLKLHCPRTNIFLFYHRPMNITTPYDSLDTYAIWHDLRLSTKNNQKKNIPITSQKIKKILQQNAHINHPRILQATKLVKTKDNKILLTGGVPIERTSSDCHYFPSIYLNKGK